MKGRKDFVSDGLVTLRHKYVDEQLKALRGDESVSSDSDNPEADKESSGKAKYLEAKNELDISLHEQLAALKVQIAEQKHNLGCIEDAYEKFGLILKKFTNLPHPDSFDKDPEATAQLEQLRVEFLRIKARCKNTENNKNENCSQPAAVNRQVSVIHELCSLNQLQMLKMGLCFALPLILGILLGCALIAWVMVFTLGR